MWQPASREARSRADELSRCFTARSAPAADRGRALPDGERRLEQQLRLWLFSACEALDQHPGAHLAHLKGGKVDVRERGSRQLRQLGDEKATQTEIVGDTEARMACGCHSRRSGGSKRNRRGRA